MRRAGFMLIELAVAALVIAVGVLALLGVAHLGERAATEVEDETRAALFADETFATLRLYSDQYSQSTNRAGWHDFWLRVVEGTQPLPVATTQLLGAWNWPELDAAGLPSIVGDGATHTNRWQAANATANAPPDFAVQYRLIITCSTENGAVLFDRDATNPPPSTLWATLH
ncbi:MAG: hypothetical protein PHR35_19580, partial [Kiritimatiellae bacterium]|nr:hypothetical protein [Kiritimatiellia bacterium]